MYYVCPSKQNLLYTLAISLTYLASVSANALPQTSPITSSGLNTQISGPIQVGGETQYNISGGTRPGGGVNLFHSFGNFDVPQNHIANFYNNSGLETANILGRVTGGNISDIFGTIKTTDFGSANLFLINPAGFLFGPNATVNVGGMVSFTSADYLKLEDGKRFNAIPNTAADALLSASPVAAFGFLGSNPGAIIVRGSEFKGVSISLVGGNITIESGTPSGGTAQQAKLSAVNGTIQLASATSPGAFDTTLQAIPNVNGASFISFGTVSLAPGSSINVRGTDTVSIRGGQFVLSVNDATLITTANAGAPNSVLLSPGSSIVSSNTGTEKGADIQIAAATLQMDGSQVTNRTTGKGNSGNISFQADTISFQNGALISSSTSGPGHGGMVKLDANTSIFLANSTIASNSQPSLGTPIVGNGGQLNLRAPSITLEQGSSLLARTTGPGVAGTIEVNTNYLSLSGESVVQASTSGSGPAGSITVQGLGGSNTKTQTVSLTGGSSLSSSSSSNDNGEGGTAGSIFVETRTLILSEGSQITTSSISSPGDAGAITINAEKEVQLSRGIITSRSESNIDDGFVDNFIIGNAGSIIVLAPTVGLKNNSRIASTTDSRYSGDPSKGNAGSVTINATNLGLIEGSQLISSSITGDSEQPPIGNAGSVTVQGLTGAAQSVLINGSSSGIFTDTQGTGSGGGITLQADTITIHNGGTLSAVTSGTDASAVGGTITVEANTMQLDSGAGITASSTGAADAGDIKITAINGLTMQNSSITTQVTENATGSTAGGGNIKVTTAPTATVYLQNSTINASVPGSGDGGNILIDPQFVILQGSRILAQTDRGTGGNITIIANVFQPDATSIVNADAGSGVNGNVTIQSPNAPASGKIQPLGNRPLQATALLTQRCAAMVGGTFSSFTVTGRDSLPTEPGGWLSSPVATDHDIGKDLEHVTRLKAMSLRLNESPTTTIHGIDREVLSLRRLTPSGFLTRTFASDSSKSCRS